jgi:hypothetical protein
LNGAPPLNLLQAVDDRVPAVVAEHQMNGWPDSTELYTSELAMRYEPSPQNEITGASGSAMAAPQAPPIS